jgi:hypothetical protein
MLHFVKQFVHQYGQIGTSSENSGKIESIQQSVAALQFNSNSSTSQTSIEAVRLFAGEYSHEV